MAEDTERGGSSLAVGAEARQSGRMAGGGHGNAAVAACGASSSGGSGSSSGPITVGVSVSLSGDFSADGLATKQGYETWAASRTLTAASSGARSTGVPVRRLQPHPGRHELPEAHHRQSRGLRGRPLLHAAHQPASAIAQRYNYVMLEGIGGGPSVFQQGLHSVYDVSASAKYQMITFAKWLAATQSRAGGLRLDDRPVPDRELDGARSYLTAHGFTSAVYKLYPVRRPTSRRSPRRSPRPRRLWS